MRFAAITNFDYFAQNFNVFFGKFNIYATTI